MRQLNSEIINEKVKYQEQQRDKNNEVKKKNRLSVIFILKPFLIKIQNLKKELADLQKNDIGMHSIKYISERIKIDTQSRADAYIRRKSNSD